MATASEKRLSLAGKVAQASRAGRDTTELQRDLAAQKIEDHIKAVVAAAPPLTDAQRDRLAALLQGGGATDAP